MSDTLKQLVGFIDDEAVERGYRKSIGAANGNTQIILNLEMERTGGNCSFCGYPWKKIDVDNPFAKFTYYQPGCHCYKKCQRCTIPATVDDKGRVRYSEIPHYMVVERFMDIAYCTACHDKDPNASKERRNKKKDGYRDGKSEMAGEKESD